MWLQAILTADDLLHALRELTPMRIQLDGDDPARVLHLDPPDEVTFRGGEGALIGTSATLQWDVVGIKVPVPCASRRKGSRWPHRSPSWPIRRTPPERSVPPRLYWRTNTGPLHVDAVLP